MAKKKEPNITPQEDKTLSPDQERFCQLYVCGGVQYAGQFAKCYKEVFGEDYKDITLPARALVREPLVMARIKELALTMQNETENIALKMQITETLRAVMEETSTHNFSDRFGNRISPAPLRAVSVNAAKALMELYPIKHVHEAKVRIEGADNGVVFNVIVPQIQKDNDDVGEYGEKED